MGDNGRSKFPLWAVEEGRTREEGGREDKQAEEDDAGRIGND